ncbi:MAG: hypothetical protein JJT94_15565 [Bernardetiaceae bacterium]|nr:hypothetical protein [Bernardetiaceae bacterium]
MESIVLHESHASKIIALSKTEVGKIQKPSTIQWVNAITQEPVDCFDEYEPSLEKEITALIYANQVNNLLPKFLRKDQWVDEDGNYKDMIVMERIYPLTLYHFEISKRQEMIKIFKEKIKELHDNNFIHGDLVRPTHYYNRNDYQWIFGNIVQTENELRLLDTGFSHVLYKELDAEKIRRFVMGLYQEKKEVEAFQAYYLSDDLNKPKAERKA